MSTIDLDDIKVLYNSYTQQARLLLSEIDAFSAFLERQSPQTQQPLSKRHSHKIHLTKFRTDVQRELNLLLNHGKVLGITVEPDADVGTSVEGDVSSPYVVSLPVNRVHGIRSSNIAFLGSVWGEMKRSQGLVAVRKQVRFSPRLGRAAGGDESQDGLSRKVSKATRERAKQTGGERCGKTRGRGVSSLRRQDKDAVTVDIIADDGAKWIKVFTKTLRWLLMDLAKEGLVDVADSDEESSAHAERSEGPESETPNHAQTLTLRRPHENGRAAFKEEDQEAVSELRLVKMGHEFLDASRTARHGIKHQHPQVYFYLTKIARGLSRDVDMVVWHLEKLGIIVFTADALKMRDERSQDDDQNLENVFQNMTSFHHRTRPTTMLNLDCTILIALISDISNLAPNSIVIPNHYAGKPAGRDIEDQIASENEDALLPKHLYPILAGQRLVCTARAATHLRNIVRVMGSANETKRSNIFLPVGPEDKRDIEELKKDLQCISIHQVPQDLQLPIQVVDNGDDEDGVLDVQYLDSNLQEQVMRRLSMHARLSPLNRSVFFYGWRRGLETISLNRVVADWLHRAMNTILDEIEIEEDCQGDIAVQGSFEGPSILVCGRERSLIGNDKQ